MRHGKTGYVQCLGYELTSCGLKYRSFNFNTAILESSIFKILFERIDDLWLYNLLCNSTVIANYRGEYVQVTGKLLTEEFRFKVLGDNWKKNRFSKTARSVDWKGKKDMYDFRKNKVVSKSKTSVGEGRPVVKL